MRVSLRTKKLLRSLIGDGNLLPAKFHERIVVPVAVSAFLFSVPLLAAILFGVALRNREDLILVSDPLSIFLGLAQFPLCYCYLLTKREKFYLLFDAMEDITDKSKWWPIDLACLSSLCIWYATLKPIFGFAFNSRDDNGTGNIQRNEETNQSLFVCFSKNSSYTTNLHIFLSIRVGYVSMAHRQIYYGVLVLFEQHLVHDFSCQIWRNLLRIIWHSISCSRIPFELNTTVRWASVVLLEILNVSCAMTVLYWIITMFVEFMLYTEAFIKDIKSIFGQIDGFSKNAEDFLLVIDRFNKIIILQNRIDR